MSAKINEFNSQIRTAIKLAKTGICSLESVIEGNHINNYNADLARFQFERVLSVLDEALNDYSKHRIKMPLTGLEPISTD